MKRYVGILLLFLSIVGYGQWSNDMLTSYLSIHDHVTYTQEQQDSILARLQEDTVINVFGPTGQNKSICDFFLYFENKNTTSSLTSRTNLKTGSNLRWNLGDGKIYYQNDIPSDTTNGVVSLTSEDGFSGMTRLDLHDAKFTGPLPNIDSICPNLTYIDINNDFDAAFTGDLTGWQFNHNATDILLYVNQLTGDLTDMFVPDLCNTFRINANKFHGAPPAYRATHTKTGFTRYYVNGNFFNSIGNAVYTPINFQWDYSNNYFSSDTIEKFIQIFKNYTDTTPSTRSSSLYFTGSYNGTIRDGESDTNLIALKQNYTDDGYTLTVNYNDTTRQKSSFKNGPYVVFSFDDGWYTDSSRVFSIFNEKGWLSTSFLNGRDVGEVTGGTDGWLHVDSTGIMNMYRQGWEFGSHTYNHANLKDSSASAISSALSDNITYMTDTLGLHYPYMFAYPFGANDLQAVDSVKKYHKIGRYINDSDPGLEYTYQDDSLYRIVTVEIGLFNDKVYSSLNNLQYTKSALSIYGHGYYDSLTQNPDTFPSYFYDVSTLQDIVDYVDSMGYKVITLDSLYQLMKPNDDYKKDLNVTTVGQGSVQVEPNKFRHDSLAPVFLQATASEGYEFTGWSGDASGTSDTRIVMDSDKSVTATFESTSPPPPSGRPYLINGKPKLIGTKPNVTP